MKAFAEALAERRLAAEVAVLSVPSGYPSPKFVNLVLRRRHGTTYLFEASAARPDIIDDMRARLRGEGVRALDALLVTHCHGDHAGSSGIIANFGRNPGERAPIYLNSVGYRFLTHPEAAFLNETYELFLTRAHWGLLEYNRLTERDTIENARRARYTNYFSRTPKSALSFVDRGKLPAGVVALPTPGHSADCVLYYDCELDVAVPGDTIICTGGSEKVASGSFVIPIFTVAGQSYSMAYERYLRTILVLERFFSDHRQTLILPPHGRFAITHPLDWVAFAKGYFRHLYSAFLNGFLGDHARRTTPFRACDLNPYIPSAGAHPISTPSHAFGMLCALADEGYLGMDEDPYTRQISFKLEALPPSDYLDQRLDENPGTITVFGGANESSA